MIASLLKWALTDEAAYAILISYKLNLTLSQALFRKKEGKMVYTVGEKARLLAREDALENIYQAIKATI